MRTNSRLASKKIALRDLGVRVEVRGGASVTMDPLPLQMEPLPRRAR